MNLMSKLKLIFWLVILSNTLAFGQDLSDSITMKKVFGGYQFYEGTKRLNMTQVIYAMKDNEEAYAHIKSAQSANVMATIFAGAGGFLVGYPIGTALAGGEANWTLAAVGAGFMLVSIPFSQKFNKQAKQAVRTYNGGRNTSWLRSEKELRLAMTGNGVGLVLVF